MARPRLGEEHRRRRTLVCGSQRERPQRSVSGRVQLG